jgi:hypothetical protein
MAEKEEVIREKDLAYSGVFDFKGFYGFSHNWLSNQENYGVVEEKYSEKVEGNSKNMDVKWVATKEVSDYFKMEIKITMKLSDLTDVEVEIDGETKRSNRGKVSILLIGSLIKDPKSKWDTSAFNRFLRDVYNKYIVPNKIGEMKGLVVNDVIALKEEMKAFLEISAKR